MIQRTVTIINKLGLHARAASKLVETARAFSANITISQGSSQANGKSIMSLLILAAPCNTRLELTIDGDDEDEAMNALVSLIRNRFDEAE
ncbi:MAG: HPr family phosphocarrier protein [Gammaproteobacteria bacterium]|nr:HPr family phosphocarrier protein [Gammaproteobacteria bacterium]